MQEVAHYLPIVTTVVATAFAVHLFLRFRERPTAMHYFWWAIGMGTYGMGTLTESLTTLLGWHPVLFRAWYITGALLGGAPLAQGSVYLHLSRRVAHRMTVGLSAVVAIASICVLLSPLDVGKAEAHRLSGNVLAWQWVRYFSPFVNLYAVVFLVGGAIVSALSYRRQRETYRRFVGNVLIAVGAVLPGIGGTATRLGHVEVLYVTELMGVVLIWFGYRFNVLPARSAV